jgi:hypothetical protein
MKLREPRVVLPTVGHRRFLPWLGNLEKRGGQATG